MKHACDILEEKFFFFKKKFEEVFNKVDSGF